MTIEKLLPFILVPIISALIGWFTNFVAIKMLFHPRKKLSLLFIKIHGVFPKRQAELAARLGDLFAEHLGVQNKIEEAIKDNVVSHNLSESLQNKVKELAENFIKTEVPFLAGMIPQDLLDKLSLRVSTELNNYLINEIGSKSNEFANKFNIKELVENQIKSLDIEELENLLQTLLKKEFRFIELSGAALGFIIGFVQLFLTYILYRNLF